MMKKRPFSFPTDKTIRVIADTDCNCECDDQFCIAHMLMTPRFDVKGLISTHYNQEKSEEKSYQEIQKITKMMSLTGEIPILHGAPHALLDTRTPIDSEGARFIIQEAMMDDERPLFLCGQGAVTNIVSAYLMEPRIAEKVVVIWIGGREYPRGGFEFNQNNDLNAARVLFQSKLELWQVPMNVYTTMKVSFFELLNQVYPYGEIGKYLVEHMMEVSKEISDAVIGSRGSDMSRGDAVTSFGGELWSLGDSICVGLMMNNTLGKFHVTEAPCNLDFQGFYDFSDSGSRKIRVYDSIDQRFILQDMFEKFHYYFGQ